MTDTTPGTDLVPFDPATSAYPVLFDTGAGGLREVLEDNFGDEGFQAGDLDRITIPTAGGTYWMVPDETPTAELKGVLVFKQKTRSYWIQALGEGESSNNPPDCASADGVLGNGVFGPGSDGNPPGTCETCPMNAFGSAAKGEGKACKEQHQLWLLREGSVLPTQVTLPPTSLKDFRKFLTRLTAKAIPFYGVEVRITLRSEKNAQGIDFAIAVPQQLRLLDPAERAAAKAYGEQIAGSIRQSLAARDAVVQEAAVVDTTASTNGTTSSAETPSAAATAAAQEPEAQTYVEEPEAPPSPAEAPTA